MVIAGYTRFENAVAKVNPSMASALYKARTKQTNTSATGKSGGSSSGSSKTTGGSSSSSNKSTASTGPPTVIPGGGGSIGGTPVTPSKPGPPPGEKPKGPTSGTGTPGELVGGEGGYSRPPGNYITPGYGGTYTPPSSNLPPPAGTTIGTGTQYTGGSGRGVSEQQPIINTQPTTTDDISPTRWKRDFGIVPPDTGAYSSEIARITADEEASKQYIQQGNKVLDEWYEYTVGAQKSITEINQADKDATFWFDLNNDKVETPDEVMNKEQSLAFVRKEYGENLYRKQQVEKNIPLAEQSIIESTKTRLMLEERQREGYTIEVTDEGYYFGEQKASDVVKTLYGGDRPDLYISSSLRTLGFGTLFAGAQQLITGAPSLEAEKERTAESILGATRKKDESVESFTARFWTSSDVVMDVYFPVATLGAGYALTAMKSGAVATKGVVTTALSTFGKTSTGKLFQGVSKVGFYGLAGYGTVTTGVNLGLTAYYNPTGLGSEIGRTTYQLGMLAGSGYVGSRYASNRIIFETAPGGFSPGRKTTFIEKLSGVNQQMRERVPYYEEVSGKVGRLTEPLFRSYENRILYGKQTGMFPSESMGRRIVNKITTKNITATYQEGYSPPGQANMKLYQSQTITIKESRFPSLGKVKNALFSDQANINALRQQSKVPDTSGMKKTMFTNEQNMQRDIISKWQEQVPSEYEVFSSRQQYYRSLKESPYSKPPVYETGAQYVLSGQEGTITEVGVYRITGAKKIPLSKRSSPWKFKDTNLKTEGTSIKTEGTLIEGKTIGRQSYIIEDKPVTEPTRTNYEYQDFDTSYRLKKTSLYESESGLQESRYWDTTRPNAIPSPINRPVSISSQKTGLENISSSIGKQRTGFGQSGKIMNTELIISTVIDTGKTGEGLSNKNYTGDISIIDRGYRSITDEKQRQDESWKQSGKEINRQAIMPISDTGMASAQKSRQDSATKQMLKLRLSTRQKMKRTNYIRNDERPPEDYDYKPREPRNEIPGIPKGEDDDKDILFTKKARKGRELYSKTSRARPKGLPPDLLSITQSQARYGSATAPKETTGLFEKASRNLFLRTPTVELMKGGNKRRRLI